MFAKIVVLLLCAGSQLCSAGHVPDLTIIRGVDAQPHEVPSMVFVSFRLKNGQSDSCGGTLIHPQFVLTAAHCLEDPNIDLIEARLGCHLKDCSDKDQAIKHSEFALHPKYTGDSISYDMGIIKLSKAAALKPGVVELSRLVEGTTVPKRNYVSQKATAYGWGIIDDGLFPHVLQKLEGKIRPARDYNFTVWFGRKDGSQGVLCFGDSGGPLFWNGLQIGVASRATTHCSLGTDSVFAGVEHHRAWIDSYIRTH